MTKLDAETLHETWLLYKETEYEPYRNKLLLHYTSLVRYVVVRRAAHLPTQVDREDLVSYGVFGLLDAIKKFDMERGQKFETYAPRRIWGAVIDELRKLDWVPRGVYSKGREIDEAKAVLQAQLGRNPEPQEVAQALGQTMAEYWEMVSDSAASAVGSTEGIFDETERDEYRSMALVDPTINLEEHAETGEIADMLADAVAGMDVRSKTVLVLYYFHEMTLADIGELLGVTESRVCQLQGKALTALSESLGQFSAAA